MGRAIKALSGFVLPLLGLLATAGEGLALQGGRTAFDPVARRAALAKGDYVQARAACLSISRDPRWARMRLPGAIKGAEDTAAEAAAASMTWAFMVLAGRALAGDAPSETDLVDLLRRAATENALSATEASPATAPQLRRTLIATIVSYSVVRSRFDEPTRSRIDAWLNQLVRSVIDPAAGDYWTDVVVTLWGSLVADEALYTKGIERFVSTLQTARTDGSLPAEAQRGARAASQHRAALAALTLIAETAGSNGQDLYGLNVDGRNLDLLLGHLMNVVAAPAVGRAYAAANFEGMGSDPGLLDLSFLERRRSGRHLMAFSEALAARPNNSSIAHRRLEVLLLAKGSSARPLIDDFSGGNATCFWLQR